jgi:beta-N-acetylhexosaminidase
MIAKYPVYYIFISIILWMPLLHAHEGTFSPGADLDSLRNHWADSVLTSLTLEEKIAQLMMVRAYSNKDESHYGYIEKLITDHNIGGLCFFQGGPARQASLTNRYQKKAKTPLFIALDAEWGLGMRLDSTFSFPYQMTLGALENDTIVFRMGKEIARQLKAIGVHINFAPVVDVNNNPANPVISSRSFGSDREQVASKGIAYMKGLQDNGIIATAKHFPGHGDTDSDSHYTLPVINHAKSRLDSVELYPFRQLIDAGIDAVMVAHLFIPAIDGTKNTPTTLSDISINGLLKKELGFKGLVITDALDMKGVTGGNQPGEIEVRAFLAGNDILLLPQDVKAAIRAIKNAVREGIITEEEINDRCRKVLVYKSKAGLNQYHPVQTKGLYDTLNHVTNELLETEIYENAIVVLGNKNYILPLKHFDTLKIAAVSAGSAEITPFQEMLSNYTGVDFFNFISGSTQSQQDLLVQKLGDYNLVIIGVHNTSIFPQKKFNISDRTLSMISAISDVRPVILALFASPYSLNLIREPEKLHAILVCHQDNPTSNEVAAQLIMGGMGASGSMPVKTGKDIEAGAGVKFSHLHRLRYSIPEKVGIRKRDLFRIDSLVFAGIRDKAMPGCQVLVAVDGHVIYRKSFGYHTYRRGNFVKNTDLYDVASITKIAAGTLAVMKLADDGMLDIDHKLVWYLPYLRGTNKEDIVIREMMAHQSRLQSWIPFYLNTMEQKRLKPEIYRPEISEQFSVKVADKLFTDRNYSFIIFDSIANSRLLPKKEYRYSDLGFILLRPVVENLTNKPLDMYLDEKFFKPLGLQHTMFNPLRRFGLNEIVPTEQDNHFRQQLIHGYVHDPAAAMLGGVSGHAGLFSNTNDMAILMQMLLQEGHYGGHRYISPETVREFTTQQFPLDKNRRGIGFDKPDPENRRNGPTGKSPSLNSFGHTGFTGTYAWVDPEYRIVYIFLSNRVHPTAENTLLIRNNIRTEIMEVIYNAVNKAGIVSKYIEDTRSGIQGSVAD